MKKLIVALVCAVFMLCSKSPTALQAFTICNVSGGQTAYIYTGIYSGATPVIQNFICTIDVGDCTPVNVPMVLDIIQGI